MINNINEDGTFVAFEDTTLEQFKLAIEQFKIQEWDTYCHLDRVLQTLLDKSLLDVMYYLLELGKYYNEFDDCNFLKEKIGDFEQLQTKYRVLYEKHYNDEFADVIMAELAEQLK